MPTYAKITQLLCFAVIVLYFSQLYSMFYLNQTDLRLLHPNQQRFPNFFIILLLTNEDADNLKNSTAKDLIDVQMHQTENLKNGLFDSNDGFHIEELYNRMETPELVYAIYRFKNGWPANARMIITAKLIKVRIALVFFSHHESEFWTHHWLVHNKNDFGVVSEIV